MPASTELHRQNMGGIWENADILHGGKLERDSTFRGRNHYFTEHHHQNQSQQKLFRQVCEMALSFV